MVTGIGVNLASDLTRAGWTEPFLLSRRPLVDDYLLVLSPFDAAERREHEHYRPCFNVTLNARPTPLPAQYAPPGQRIACPRSLTKLISQAGMAVQADNRRKWLALEPIDTHDVHG